METPIQATETQTAPCCSPKNRLICISLGLVLIIIFTTLGFLLGKYFALPKNSIVAQVVPTPISAKNPITNWNTYSTASFSLKYPNNWENPKIYQQSTKTEYLFTPSNLRIIEGIHFNQNLGRALTYEEEVKTFENNAIGRVEVMVAGKETIKYINKIGESATEESVILPTPDDLCLWITMPVLLETDPLIFDQILSTFRFD
jgi:hypothetical protein